MSKTISYLNLFELMRIYLPLNLGCRIKLSAYGAFELGKTFQTGMNDK
jgi:hypothetical protein